MVPRAILAPPKPELNAWCPHLISFLMKQIKIKNPKRLHRIFRIIRIFTTIEWLYIVICPYVLAAIGHPLKPKDPLAIANIVIGVVFTVISEVVIQLMQSVTFKNHALIKDAQALKNTLS